MAKAKILLLEDKVPKATSIRPLLLRLGYKVESSTTVDVIRKTTELRPALVLINIKAQRGSDAGALAGVLKARFRTPVIVLAGPADRKRLIRGGLVSASECMKRPSTDHELRAGIESVLEKSGGGGAPLLDESWCHSVVCSIRDAVIVTEKTGLVVFLNPAAEKLTGWSLDDATGRPLAEVFKALGEDSGRPISLQFGKITGRRLGGLPERLVLSTRGGISRHIENSIAALYGAGGRPVGVVLLFRDVTERYLMAQSALSRQKVEAIGTLAKGIAHDFGILIGKIDAHASSLAESLIPKTKAHEAATRISEATREARELTSHLADLAQATEPRLPHATTAVSVAQVLADAAKVLEKTFSDHHIVFTTGPQEKMPFAKADAAQLLDLLICLFTNSVDAMPEGGTLTFQADVKNFSRPGQQRNPEARKGRYAVLTVKDTGLGMSRETMSHIFEPFFTTKQPSLIKGLGMTIVHATILSWGGWITVQSALKKGTTVNLHIPVAEVPAAAVAESSAGGETILVIDDSESDRSLFRSILEEQGYRVHVAENGVKGISMLHELSDKVDLVIIDLIMSQVDGRDVFRRIIEEDPDANVIMVSGFSRDYVRSYLGQGGWGFVQKPIEKDQLLHSVSRAMEQRHVQDGGGESGNSDADSGNIQES